MNLTNELSPKLELNSACYQGHIKHQRYHPKKHSFDYAIAMLVLDLDEITLMDFGRLFSWKKLALLRFQASDYLNSDCKQHTTDANEQNNGNAILQLKRRVLDKVAAIVNQQQPLTYSVCDRVMFAGQVRHFGIYFSPVNFFFCYQKNTPYYMLAEVSNTPWNERHYYVVDLNNVQATPKAFHVSPFMNMDMDYKWHIKPPKEQLAVTINAISDKPLFSANMLLSRQALTKQNLKQQFYRFPLMTVKILLGIYWQALKLFIKGIKYVPYSTKTKN